VSHLSRLPFPAAHLRRVAWPIRFRIPDLLLINGRPPFSTIRIYSMTLGPKLSVLGRANISAR
jgi:hypothetical protein